MKLKLKPLNEQVIVITGASSGIGLVTAKMAAGRGARVVLAARNGTDLRTAVDAIREKGGRAVHVVADVASPDDVERIAAEALRAFGTIDTWVNNAAAAVYGLATEVDIEDLRRQFDVTYWGQVYGSRTAVRHLRRNGGALINVASVAADRAVPLQANYSAAKHAVKGFTDGLRMELEAEGLPIAVTLIKPASIDTPFFDKAKTYLGVEPQPVPPVYAPDLVAGAILHAAEQPVRDVFVGGGGRMLSAATSIPRMADRYMKWRLFDQQRSDRRSGSRPDNLHAPVAFDGGVRGQTWQGRTRSTSVYTAAALRPGLTAAVAGATALALVAGPLLTRKRRQGHGDLR